jgi:hypothetical protein
MAKWFLAVVLAFPIVAGAATTWSVTWPNLTWELSSNGDKYPSSTSCIAAAEKLAAGTYKCVPSGDATIVGKGSTVATDPPPVNDPPPPTTSGNVKYWVYYAGTMNWAGDFSYAATINYSATSNPLTAPFDIAVNSGAYGAWQPYACGNSPFTSYAGGAMTSVCNGTFEFKNAGYTAITFAVKPTVANWSGSVYFTGIGDVNLNCGASLPGNYGPAPVANQWNVYTVPLSDLCVAGVANLYKFAIQDTTGASDTWYIDNVGFE